MLTPDQTDGLIERLDRIQQLTGALAKVGNDAIEQQDLAERISREILEVKEALTSAR